MCSTHGNFSLLLGVIKASWKEKVEMGTDKKEFEFGG